MFKRLHPPFLALKIGKEDHEPRNEEAGKSPELKASKDRSPTATGI